MDILQASPIAKSFLAGSVSGTLSTALFQPLDLVKTRLQSTAVCGSSVTINGIAAQQNGMIKILETIIRNEKMYGLWKGFSPSLYRCVPGVGMYFSSLHALKSHMFADGVQPTASQSLVLGASARTMTAAAMLPFTVVKTRFESGQYKYRNVSGALKEIYTIEGKNGLYKGLAATLIRDAPFSGLYLMFYSHAKKTASEMFELNNGLIHFSCGIFAGVCASTITQPADVIKTSMQINKGHERMNQVILSIYKTHGLNGFFRGLLPRVMRRSCIAAMAWTVYEEIMNQLGLKT